MIGRWIHYMSGVAWIGLLYYFNFVQGPFFAETDSQTKSSAIRLLVPRALWWFRWAAALTWVSGVYMLLHRGHYAGHAIYATSWGVWILLGGAMATIMAYNVWFIIWPNQKILIASANAVASGGQADPRGAAAGAKAGLASRTNVLLSIPMLFFMGAASHLSLNITPETNFMPLVITLAAILAAIEINAFVGKMGPMTTVKGVIHSGLGLAVILYLIVTCMI